MSNYLPPALVSEKNNLSDEVLKKIENLSGAKPEAFLFQILSAWSVVIIAITLAIYFNSYWVSAIAIVIIATRLNVFGLLVHEQVHLLGLRGKYGDLIVNLLVAYPIGITMENYSQVHLLHHQYFLTEKDPDYLRKSGEEWYFPMSARLLTKLFLSDLLGLSFIKLLKGKKLKNIKIFKRKNPTPIWVRPLYYSVVVMLLTYMQMWSIALIYWIIPLITIFPAIIRLIAITEHTYCLLQGESVLNSTPLIIQKWWEKILLPNLDFNLHIYHHYFPRIAFCNLQKVHEIFCNEKLVNEQNIFNGYWSYLKFLQTRKTNSN